MKRIDLFMPVKGAYNVLHHFTEKLAEAIERQGVKTRILEAVYKNPKAFIDILQQDPPDCTLSFNGLLPDDHGRFFCELIKIPHVACLTLSAPIFVKLTRSPMNIIACSDRFDCDFFQGLNFYNTLFMPQAIERDLEMGSSQRIYDVVMFATLIDYVDIRDRWHQDHPPLVAAVLEGAAELALSKADVSCVQALVTVLDDFMRGNVVFNPNELDMIESLIEIESYVNGKNQAELIRSIKDTRVDIFGEAPTTTSWKKFLRDNPNVVVHKPVSFTQAIEVVKQSKIVLNANASSKNGGHEIVFAGLAAGAVVLSPENIYLREFFKDGTNIGFYTPGSWRDIQGQIKDYLGDEKRRIRVAEAGRDIVMRTQTWDNRAQELVPRVSSILETMKNRAV